jgi:hypothetical protein
MQILSTNQSDLQNGVPDGYQSPQGVLCSDVSGYTVTAVSVMVDTIDRYSGGEIEVSLGGVSAENTFLYPNAYDTSGYVPITFHFDDVEIDCSGEIDLVFEQTTQTGNNPVNFGLASTSSSYAGSNAFRADDLPAWLPYDSDLAFTIFGYQTPGESTGVGDVYSVIISGMPGTTTCSVSATSSSCQSEQSDVLYTHDFGLAIGLGLLLALVVTIFIANVFYYRK